MSLNNLLSQNSGVKHIPTYQSYRREILEAAAVHKLRVHSIEFDKGPDGQPIFSDIISTAINPDKPTYVQLAGCHGVEGYLGSLIQRKYLQSISREQLDTFNLVIVHPVCPFGMAWYRRVNSQNIDLNRNFFSTTQRPLNRGFEALIPLLNSRNKLEFALKVVTTSLKEGYVASRRMLGQGQYEFPDKPFYGGHIVQEETLQILGYLKTLLSDISKFTIFDIHSGLGKPGVEVILGLPAYSANPEAFKKTYPEKQFASLKEESWECTGAFGEAVRHFFNNTEVTYLVQEFGTAGNLFVLYALMQDHQNFSENKTDLSRIQHMLKAFFLPDKQLQKFAIGQAFKTFALVTGIHVKEKYPLFEEL